MTTVPTQPGHRPTLPTRATESPGASRRARLLGRALSIAVGLLVVAGCGSADQKDDLFGSGELVGGGTGAGGTTSGDAAAGGTSGSGGGRPLACAADLCPAAPGEVACCNQLDYRCGIRIGEKTTFTCVTPDRAGVLDTRCPSRYFFGNRGEGCCRSDGTCGNWDEKYGAGCVDPVQLGAGPGAPCR